MRPAPNIVGIIDAIDRGALPIPELRDTLMRPDLVEARVTKALAALEGR